MHSAPFFKIVLCLEILKTSFSFDIVKRDQLYSKDGKKRVSSHLIRIRINLMKFSFDKAVLLLKFSSVIDAFTLTNRSV